MKLGIALLIIGFMVGALLIGIFPEQAAMIGMVVAIPGGGIIGWKISEKVSGGGACLLTLAGFAFLIIYPVWVGWMTWADWGHDLDMVIGAVKWVIDFIGSLG